MQTVSASEVKVESQGQIAKVFLNGLQAFWGLVLQKCPMTEKQDGLFVARTKLGESLQDFHLQSVTCYLQNVM